MLKKKISNSMKDKWQDPEYRENIIKAQNEARKPVTLEFRDKMSKIVKKTTN